MLYEVITELLLAAAEQNGVVVQPGEVDLQLTRMREANGDFDAAVERRYGSAEAFRLRLKQEMTIQRNIDEHVLQGAGDDAGRRARLVITSYSIHYTKLYDARG